MNSLCLYTIVSCLFAVSTQQSKTAILPKHSDPPMKKTHPEFWGSPSDRKIYIQSKNVWFIKISRDGNISGSKSPSSEAIILMVSGGNQTVALKGRDAGKYICMDNNARIYSSDTPERDCFFVEEYRQNNYNTYHHPYHRRGDKKYYLAINDDGTVTIGNSDDPWIFFLPVPKETIESSSLTVTTSTVIPVTTTRTPIPTTSTVAPNLKKLEKTRKRRRRWCKLLIRGRLERKPDKYLKRCKHDCNILRTMLDNIKRYKRKCEKQRQRRRRRNKRKYQRKHGPNHRRRHESKRTRKNRGRGRARKRTPVRTTTSPQTHKIDVT